ncbi:MAG: TraB/GumN family protein [Oscillospiraceae bacterium]|nr:TraB/GumN family protein [Oscillospiraceae bacterium]
MKKRILIFSLLLVVLSALLLVGCAAETKPEPEQETIPEVEVIDTTEPNLYEPEEPDEEYVPVPDEPEPAVGFAIHGAIHRVEYGDNVAYIFGTLHGSRPEWFPLSDIVEDAMARADVFALEFDMSDMGALEAEMEELMFLSDGQTWADVLPQAAYDHLVYVIASYEIPYEDVRNMNPVLLVYTIALEFISLLSDVDMITTVDGYVRDIALARGLPVIGLETVAQQMDIVFNPPIDVAVEQIMEFLPPMEMLMEIMNSDEASLDELADMYESNDISAIAEAFARTSSVEATIDSPAGIYSREIIMNYRSTYYANAIARLLRETEEPTTFFVAVGLSHVMRSLGGEEFTDIVEQLGLLGFEVVPLW